MPCVPCNDATQSLDANCCGGCACAIMRFDISVHHHLQALGSESLDLDSITSAGDPASHFESQGHVTEDVSTGTSCHSVRCKHLNAMSCAPPISYMVLRGKLTYPQTHTLRTQLSALSHSINAACDVHAGFKASIR